MDKVAVFTRMSALALRDFDFRRAPSCYSELQAYHSFVCNILRILNCYTMPRTCSTFSDYREAVLKIETVLYSTPPKEFYQQIRTLAQETHQFFEREYYWMNTVGPTQYLSDLSVPVFFSDIKFLRRSFFVLLLIQKIMRDSGHPKFRLPASVRRLFAELYSHYIDYARKCGL